ncbi:subtilisin-like protein [Crassisporium funariophilum]|nr:subtilisin-like protein [Crassisporium funariophilum]
MGRLTAVLYLFIGLSLYVKASPLVARHGEFTLHEKRQDHPEWKLSRRLESHVNIPLRIGLKQRNLHLIPEYLMSVSDPASPAYGQHWSQEKVVEIFAPSSLANETVHAWLMDAGFEPSRLRVSHNKAWIDVHGATTVEVERLLNTEYHVYEHDNGEEHIACHEYSLPAGIAGHIEMVTPTVQPGVKLATPAPLRPRSSSLLDHRAQLSTALQARATSSPASLEGCDTTIVPSCLKTLYNMTYTPNATDRNTFGIVSYYSNTYLQSDLDTFFGNFSPSLVGKSPELVSINGGSIALDPASDVGEDGWILQYAMTLVQSQPVQFLQVGNQQIATSFNEWLDAVDGSYCTSDGGDDFSFDPQLPNPFPGGFNDHSCGTATPPNVVSNSQAIHEISYSKFYRERQCNEFAKLGLMGVTILYSGGNTGVGGAQSGYCLDDNGSMNLNGTHYNPAWPASCPWVTVVGGTQVKANGTGTPSDPLPEEVWNQDMTLGFFQSSGGGFSNQYPQPAYQKSAVNKYLKASVSKAELKNFNSKGRAYPDISAIANNFYSLENGSVISNSGTSGAVPTVASIITLVNDARISAGKKPVGFINPTIYPDAFASAFNDITTGTSQGCKGCEYSDISHTCWDPATGVGTPNLGKLIEKWLALP